MIEPRLLTRCGLVLQLSASTSHARDADAKVLVADVEEAVRLGADAVTVHVNVGSDTEAAQLADLGSVAGACDRWGIPLLAMIYPRGPRIIDPSDPELLAHAAGIAADLGADIVKTPLAVPVHRMREVVASCPLPVIVAGGTGDHHALPELAAAALSAGCSGLAAGRRVFTSPSPREAVSRLAAIVHGGTLPASQATNERVVGVL
jgi:2-amino-4,5-dihydroxy-6-oxo-7-(phosphonooxy)heptanoate synthase